MQILSRKTFYFIWQYCTLWFDNNMLYKLSRQAFSLVQVMIMQ